MTAVVNITNGSKKKHRKIKAFEKDIGIKIKLCKARSPQTKGKDESVNIFVSWLNACVKVANFAYIKTLEDFDFSYQPSINRGQIFDFKNLRFLERKENIRLVGTPGVGKTHLATAIGIEAAKKSSFGK